MCLMAGYDLPLEKWKRKPRLYEAPKPAITPEGFRAAILARQRAEAAAGLAVAAGAQQDPSAMTRRMTSNGAVHADAAQPMDVEGGGDSDGCASERAVNGVEARPRSAEGSADRVDAAEGRGRGAAALAEPAEASEACGNGSAPGEERSSGRVAADGGACEARHLHLQEKARRRVRRIPWAVANRRAESLLAGFFNRCCVPAANPPTRLPPFPWPLCLHVSCPAGHTGGLR